MWTTIWASIAIVSFIIEISSAALLSIWFTAGAIVALIMSLLNFPVFIQILSFIAVTGALFYYALKHIIRKKPEKTSVLSSVVGKRATVIETINFSKNTGKIKVNDQYWKAIPKNEGEIIKKDSIVTVVDVKNNIIVVDTDENNE